MACHGRLEESNMIQHALGPLSLVREPNLLVIDMPRGTPSATGPHLSMSFHDLY